MELSGSIDQGIENRGSVDLYCTGVTWPPMFCCFKKPRQFPRENQALFMMAIVLKRRELWTRGFRPDGVLVTTLNCVSKRSQVRYPRLWMPLYSFLYSKLSIILNDCVCATSTAKNLNWLSIKFVPLPFEQKPLTPRLISRERQRFYQNKPRVP